MKREHASLYPSSSISYITTRNLTAAHHTLFLVLDAAC